MFRVLKSTLFSLFIFCSLFTAVSAQSIPGVSEPITLESAPGLPKPNTEVVISAESLSTDLNRAQFSWFVNDKLYRKGTGLTEITIPSGKSGSITTVSIEVKTSDIGFIRNQIVIKPADVTLVWKSDGYVPPFYKGKSLELYGSSFMVTAIPEFFTANGTKIDPKTLVYTWTKNGNAEPIQSGYGKDTFTDKQTSFVRGGDDIRVEVSTLSHDIGATATITLSPVSPDFVFYENSPLYGIIYETALSESFTLVNEELSLLVEPYNISTKKPLSEALTYDWTLNDTPVTTFKDKNGITLRKTGTVSGQSDIQINIQNTDRLLQGGQAGITIFQ